MKKILLYVMVCSMALTSCTDVFHSMNVPNKNAPSLEDLSKPEEFYLLLRNGYSTWYNAVIAASPSAGFACAEIFQFGYNSWGAGDMWYRPRRTLFNDDAPDPVIIINFGAWYNLYGSMGLIMKMSKMFDQPGFAVELNGEDYTQRARAHCYIVQALLYGNIALLYDKAYLFTQEHDYDTFDFKGNTKGYQEVMAYALKKLDEAIAIIEADPTDKDLDWVVADTRFDKASLLKFANSMAARFMACLPRTQAENAMVDWNKVKEYAEKGLTSDLEVEYMSGWRGRVMTRDVGQNCYGFYRGEWSRVSQWLINRMAPGDPNAVYPIPAIEGTEDYKDWPAVTTQIETSPDVWEPVPGVDQRIDKYFEYKSMRNWNPSNNVFLEGRGTFMLTQYAYTRFNNIVDASSGKIPHFMKIENDLYIAEALIRTGGDRTTIAEIINRSRVDIGGLDPALATDSYDELEKKLFHERYVECDLVWPHLGFFDKRRGIDQMIPGTVRHFPIPGPELLMNGQALYTFGGIGNEM